MRSFSISLVTLVALAGPAAAGPGTIYDFICSPSLRVVGDPAIRFIHPQFSAEPGETGFGSQCIQGCYVEGLRVAPDNALPKGRRYLALVTPAGGAACSTTATVVAAIPLAPFDALGALLGVA